MFNVDDNVPLSPREKCLLLTGLDRRPDGENWDKREGAASSGNAGAIEEQGVERGGCGEPPKAALPSPSMKRPVDVKAHFRFLLSVSLFPFSQAASVGILPSALFCERYWLGASWVQCVSSDTERSKATRGETHSLMSVVLDAYFSVSRAS
jgi:hypothetical protein